MDNKYPETGQTFESLKNLGAESNFVSFKNIFNEVKRIRLSNNLKGDTINLRTRVRRSLTNNEKTVQLNPSEQSRKLNITLIFKDYQVKSKYSIPINEKGNVKNTNDVEENSFKLVKNNIETQ